MNTGSLFASVQNELISVETQLNMFIQSPVSVIADVGHHLVQAGGKRLRPALYLLCAKNGGRTPSPPELLPMAVAIEMVHMATLVHDDVIDNAAIRRGLPTANTCWGNRLAVLSGDYLFAKAFWLVASKANNTMLQVLTEVIESMCEGEILQSQECFQVELAEDNYLQRTAKKTADFIAASCRLGGLSAGLAAADIEALAQYGHAIGMAYQITDDILDVIASSQQIGKPVGNDLRQGILTLPVIYALQNSAQRRDLAMLITARDMSEPNLAAALGLVKASNAIDYSYARVNAYINQARQAVPACLAGDVRDLLLAMTDFIATRDY